MKKKLMLLGGSEQQVVAITKAKDLGYYTVLCDYLPDNPGKAFADKYYSVSTTDKEKVLQVAISENINGILAYASDPAAPTAAYVAEQLHLPGNPYRSVEILCNKDKYRAFLKSNGFHTPNCKCFDNISEAEDSLKKRELKFPVIVKPVDSSGSKGVSLINDIDSINPEVLERSFSYSRCKRIIIEEYVEKYGYQIAGDGLSIDGKLVFRYFANDHFDKKSPNPFVPVAASFPYFQPPAIQDKIHGEIQRLLTLLNMSTCTYNFDIRIDKDLNVYLMEIAPRNGGNFIPNVIKHATGVDLVDYSVKAAMGSQVCPPENATPKGYWSYYTIHSYKSGILKQISISKEYEKCIVESYIVSNPGEYIEEYTGANKKIGCLVMKFDSLDEMLKMMDNSEQWIKVELE